MKKTLLIFIMGLTVGVYAAETVIKLTSWVENAPASDVIECKQNANVLITYTVPTDKTWTGQVKIVGREKDVE
jgi:hypothetical protein